MSLKDAVGAISPYPIVQVGWAVTNIEAAVEQWVTLLGAGPFFRMSHIPLLNVRYRGKPSTFDHSNAIAQWGSVEIELMEQHCDTPSHIRDIFPNLGTGFANVSWFAPDLAAETRRLEAMGFPLVWQCNIFDELTSALWFDTRSVLGGMVEVFSEHPVMRESFVKIAESAVGWKGDRPLRPMDELMKF